MKVFVVSFQLAITKKILNLDFLHLPSVVWVKHLYFTSFHYPNCNYVECWTWTQAIVGVTPTLAPHSLSPCLFHPGQMSK